MRTLIARVQAHWQWKLLGVGIFIGSLPAYLAVQRAGSGRAVTMPWTAADLVIPLLPALLPVYLGQLTLVGLPFLFITDLRVWMRACAGLMAAAAISLSIHFLWPTQVDRPSDVPDLAALHAVDGVGSACPSLHAVCAIYGALLCHSLPFPAAHRRWLLALIWTWTATVLFACVSLRQHSLTDLAAGAVLGGTAALIAGVHRREESS